MEHKYPLQWKSFIHGFCIPFQKQLDKLITTGNWFFSLSYVKINKHWVINVLTKGLSSFLKKYSRTPITRTRMARTKSNFLWISPHFSVIFTWITRIPHQLELNFISLDQKFVDIYPNNSNSGSCNSTQMPPISSSSCLRVKTLTLILGNTTSIWF